MSALLRALRRFRSERAAAAVEFALVMPILFILVFGIVDMGRLLFTANSLTSAVRDGARFAAVQTADDPALVRAHMRPILNASIRFPEVTDAQILATWSAANRTTTVQIDQYPFNTITPFANLVGLATIELSPSATFRWERAP